MMIILPYTSTIRKEDIKGKTVVVKRAVKRHSQIDLEDILDVTEYVNKDGSINPKKCIVQHKDLGASAYDVSPVYLWDLRQKHIQGFKVQGFKIKQNEEKSRERRLSRKSNR